MTRRMTGWEHPGMNTHVVASTIDRGSWKFTGGDTPIDLVAAGTNALNGRKPAGTSQRELRELGLLPDTPNP